MGQYGDWVPIKALAAGGQGQVHKAVNEKRIASETGSDRKQYQIEHLLRVLTATVMHGDRLRLVADLVEALRVYGEAVGALKVLHQRDGYQKAIKRLNREVEALHSTRHPNLLRILDADMGQGWFVSEFHERGPLSRDEWRLPYRGDALRTLTAVRGLVEALAELHKAEGIHRDIKLHNIFVANDGRLVLGDLGLIFFRDAQKTRLSDTMESVGTEYWKAPWVETQRVEEVKATQDVYGIGKVIYCLIAGKPRLSRESHHQDQNDLEKLFPNQPGMREANEVLDRCVVVDENRCLTDAGELLKKIDLAIRATEAKWPTMPLRENKLRCRICQRHTYDSFMADSSRPAGPTDDNGLRLFGLSGGPEAAFKVLRCTFCGHVEIFHFPGGKSLPKAWDREAWKRPES